MKENIRFKNKVQSFLPFAICNYVFGGISLDPIQGCPYRCAYCLWKPFLLTGTNSVTLLSPQELNELYNNHINKYNLSQFEVNYNPIIPLTLGNATDFCVSKSNRQYLLNFLEIYSKNAKALPLFISTKALLSKSFINDLKKFDVKIFLAISISNFKNWEKYEPNVPSPFERLKNFEKIANSNNLFGIHRWRPVLNKEDNYRDYLTLLKNSGCKSTIFSGLGISKKMAENLNSDIEHPLHDYFDLHKHKLKSEYIDNEDIILEMIDYSKEINYPTYLRQTSCAVSSILHQPDYFSSFRSIYKKRCIQSNCPTNQRHICSKFKNANIIPDNKLLCSIADFLNIKLDHLNYEIEKEHLYIDSEIPIQIQNFLSHATGFLVKAKSLLLDNGWAGTHIL